MGYECGTVIMEPVILGLSKWLMKMICSSQALFDLFLSAINVKPSENKWHLEMVVHGIKGEGRQYILPPMHWVLFVCYTLK